MKVTRSAIAFFAVVVFFVSAKIDAQIIPRTIGARAYLLDDGSGSGKSLSWDVAPPLVQSYRLHFPSTPPINAINFLASDANGNLAWVFNTLPPLAPGNIWYGNALSVATPLAPTVTGAILSLNNSLMPEWTTTIPLSTTISASQITSGIIPSGTIIGVGPGAIIEPVSTTINGPVGIINANLLSGSGVGKYSGKITIPSGASHIDIPYSLISALSSVTVSVFDPQATTFGFVEAQVSVISPGIGFRVIFSADYPNSNTGEIHYTVVNP